MTATEGEGIPKSILGQVIRTYSDEIRFCYQRFLEGGNSFQGNVASEFKIGWDGWVTEASVGKSNVPNSAVLQCMVNQISQWRFPCPDGGGSVTVRYPWLLRLPGNPR